MNDFTENAFDCVVDYIVKTGCENTIEGNWIVDYSELCERFPNLSGMVLTFPDTLASLICQRPEVADLDYGFSAGEPWFDVCFWGKFCHMWEEK